MRGRYFQTPLGELPESALQERGELGIRAPYGVPPAGGQYAPASVPGDAPVNVALSDRQSNWQSIVFVVGLSPIKIQDFTYRKFFMIQNKSAAGSMYVGFGYEPTPENGIILPAGVAFEPYSYPTNDVWVSGTSAGMLGVLFYGT